MINRIQTGIARCLRRLIGGSERDNENLRAFGYFGADPAISQRTANETIKVLGSMR
ncbi:MAG: hypothetical protein ABI565_06425 [Vicinamibacteria bacterium]